jgi:hypothetical protein
MRAAKREGNFIGTTMEPGGGTEKSRRFLRCHEAESTFLFRAEEGKKSGKRESRKGFQRR